MNDDWEDFKLIRYGIKVNNFKAKQINEHEEMIEATFIAYDKIKDQVVLRYGNNKFTTVLEYQAKYWQIDEKSFEYLEEWSRKIEEEL